MRDFLLVVCALVGLVSVSRAETPVADSALRKNDSGWTDASVPRGKTVIDTSIVDLIAHGDRLNGTQVRVRGFLRLDFEATGVYMSRDTYNDRQLEYSVDVYLTPHQKMSSAQFQGRLVLLEGTFHKAFPGLGAVGKLTNVRSLEVFK